MNPSPSRAARLSGAVAWVGSLLALTLTIAAPRLSGFGQAPASAPRPTGTGLIVGRVVDGDGGTPIAGAVVTIVLPAEAGRQGDRGGSPPDIVSALITVAQTGRIGTAPQTIQMLTDADGWFAFTSLPAGVFTFRAALPGYSGGGYNQRQPDSPGQPLPLLAGQRIGDLTLKLWKEASMSGTVVDETGEPVVGAFVRVLRRDVVGGRPVLTMSGGGRPTDDRGQYRAFGLTPGDYVVCVPAVATTVPVSAEVPAPPSTMIVDNSQVLINLGGPATNPSGQRVGNLILQTGAPGRGLAVPPPVTETSKVYVYPTVFYPAGSVSSRATVVTLKSGEARSGVDMQLPLVPTVRVSGIVTAPDGPARGLQLHLVNVDADQGLAETAPDDVAMSTTDPQGQFTFLGVPRGQYQIRATRQSQQMVATLGADGSILATRSSSDPTLWFAAPVTTDQSDVTGLAFVLQPGLTVSGHIAFEGVSPQPTPQQMGRSNMRLTASQAGAGRAGGGGNQVVTVNADGTFTGPGFVPGRYSVIPPQWPALKWITKSIVAGNKDVSDVPIDLTGDLATLTITFTDQPAHVTGTVRDVSNRLDPNTVVVLFPPDPRAWGWPNGLHTRSVPVTPAGTFSLASLPAGDYAIAAIPDGWQSSWRDPAILEKLLPLATRVQLRAGDTRTEELHTVTIK